MSENNLNRIFIYILIYIIITIFVYLNYPFQHDYSSTILEVINSLTLLKVKHFKYDIKTTFVETSENIFVLGAAARNATIGKSWSEYVVYGQIDRRILSREQLSCCFRYANGSVINVNSKRKYNFGSVGDAPLGILNILCPNPMGSYGISNTLPEDIALITHASSCQSKRLKFIKPSYPLRQSKGSFAINSKVSHDNLDPNLIINWIETYRLLGATKICTCAYSSLNKEARKVLEYYSSTGFLDLYTIELANTEKYPRDFHIATPQESTDQIVFTQHMFEQHRGYHYYSAIDWDEFIIPNENISLLDLASSILDQNKWTSIMFKSQFYIKNNNGSAIENNTSLLPLSAYRWTLPEVEINRPKLIYRPDDIDMAFVHRVFPKEYRRLGKESEWTKKIYICPESAAILYHCRRCIPPGKETNDCMTPQNLVMDDKLARWAEKNLKSQVLDVHSKLKIND